MENLERYFNSDQKPPLLLLVGPSIEKLDRSAEQICSLYKVNETNLGKELSQFLISHPKSDYTSLILDWVRVKIDQAETEPILFSHIDLLFEPSFRLDPLFLFKQNSRNHHVIVLWAGSFQNDKLSYASREHSHYRIWGNPGVEVIQL
jgi:hypothetical protein